MKLMGQGILWNYFPFNLVLTFEIFQG